MITKGWKAVSLKLELKNLILSIKEILLELLKISSDKKDLQISCRNVESRTEILLISNYHYLNSGEKIIFSETNPTSENCMKGKFAFDFYDYSICDTGVKTTRYLKQKEDYGFIPGVIT